MTSIRRRDHVLMLLTLAIGLAADIYTGFIGQLAISVVVWAVLFYVLARMNEKERASVMACLVIATAGEITLSLGWGLYTYRLENIPHFIPPGHVLMLLLGLGLARHLSEKIAVAVLSAAGVYAVLGVLAGFDTFACALMAMLAVLAFALPRHRRLYASTFLLSFGLELYGTWLGNWTWANAVPGTGLVTTNPPALAGAFYATLDALVLGSLVLLGRTSSVSSAGRMEPAGGSS